MTDFTTLEIRIEATGAEAAKRAIRALGGEVKSAADETKNSTGKMKQGFVDTEAAANRVKTAIAGILTVATVKKIAEFSDAWTEAGNGLRRFTDGANDLKKLQADLLDVANSTRSSVDATSALFAKLSLATEEMGLQRTELLDIVTTINQSFQLGGASAAEAAGAIRQLGQALASGALRGDEFNSIAEQAPGIMEAIAIETGKSIGELRDFAAEGKITAEIVVAAVQNSSDRINQLFQETERTFSSYLTESMNNMKAFIGESQGVGLAIEIVGESMVTLSENSEAVAAAVGAIATAFSLKFVPALAGLSGPIGIAAAAIASLYVGVKELAEYLSSDDIRNMSTESILNVDNIGVAQIEAEIDSVLQRLTGLTTVINDTLDSRNGNRYQLSELYQQHLDEAEQMAIQLDNLADARQALIGATEGIGMADPENPHAFRIEFDFTPVKDIVENTVLTAEQAMAQVQAELDASPHKFNIEFDLTIPTEGWVEGKDADFPYLDPARVAMVEAMEKMQEEWTDAQEEFKKLVADDLDDVEQIFTDSFLGMIQAGENAFESIGQSFKEMLETMVAQLIASNLMEFFGITDWINAGGLRGGGGGLLGLGTNIWNSVTGGGATGFVNGVIQGGRDILFGNPDNLPYGAPGTEGQNAIVVDQDGKVIGTIVSGAGTVATEAATGTGGGLLTPVLDAAQGSWLGSLIGRGEYGVSTSLVGPPAPDGSAAASTAANTASSGFGDFSWTGGFDGSGWMANMANAGLDIVAGAAGSAVGTAIAESFTDKVAESNIGATIGGAIGSFVGGPLGSFLGSALGGMVDTLTGGDGYVRSNAGLMVGGSATQTPAEFWQGREGIFSLDPFASGLQVAGYAHRQDQSAARAVADMFREVDQMAVDYIEALGGSINMSGMTISGLSQDGQMGSVGTFMGIGGKTTEADLEGQILSFGKQILANAQGLDSALMAAIAAAGTVEEVATVLNTALAEKQAADAAAAAAAAAVEAATETAGGEGGGGGGGGSSSTRSETAEEVATGEFLAGIPEIVAAVRDVESAIYAVGGGGGGGQSGISGTSFIPDEEAVEAVEAVVGPLASETYASVFDASYDQLASALDGVVSLTKDQYRELFDSADNPFAIAGAAQDLFNIRTAPGTMGMSALSSLVQNPYAEDIAAGLGQLGITPEQVVQTVEAATWYKDNEAQIMELTSAITSLARSSSHGGSPAQMIKDIRRFTELIDRWEIDGMPPTRA